MQVSSSDYLEEVLNLLQQLISTPSFSKEENETASIIAQFFKQHRMQVERKGNNLWAKNLHYQSHLPTILLNSHHDTVKPASTWTTDPFVPLLEGDRLTGLGSNDAGAALVSLIATFLHYYSREDLPYNLIVAATAEEEISGANGIASILDELGDITLGIIGEPTEMQMAVAEKGLMVLDCYTRGKSGHAARKEGENAIYKALTDIAWFESYQFPEESPFLGPVHMMVTQIEAGTQHNVVPDTCHFVVDVRTTDVVNNQEALTIIEAHVQCEVKARSLRLNASGIGQEHPIVQQGTSLGLRSFGSPTLSDQALIPFPTIKIGPGDSARSHTAGEYILLSEMKEGIELYIQLLDQLQL